ncbi:uncharacterized protein LOC126846891 [Adelges cooleyi]|uniref:uncharacterized protein LOC126846891 n=1 Tax=Adelges cooleyi TaxID=133065 RepID=UPI00217F6526|nr:uncharacterized protein LOC126846891 [Adelges cooleyi]
MKLCCLLITYYFVLVSSEDYEAEFRKEFFRTNLTIEKACKKNVIIVEDNSVASGLEYIIEKMVNDDIDDHEYHSYESFDKLNFLVAVPEQTDIIVNIPGYEHLEPMHKAGHLQYVMQQEIRNELLVVIPIPDESIDYGALDLTTLAEHRRRFVEPTIKNIFKRILGPMYDQFMMQLELEIRGTLNFGGSNLMTILEERRLSGTSLENVIRRVLGVDKKQYESVRAVPLLGMCRFMGIYLSTRFPKSYIKNLVIDPDNNTCILDNGTTQKKFKQINGVWWQMSTDERTQQLLDQHL